MIVPWVPGLAPSKFQFTKIWAFEVCNGPMERATSEQAKRSFFISSL
jgi:hypothetical protein